MDRWYGELAPCGVFCGACPSFEKTCKGCSAANLDQKRSSWQSCRIRRCCFEINDVATCAACDDFPCNLIHKKLIDSHPGDPRFAYRHEIPENIQRFRKLGISKYLTYQREKWECPDCGGRITFYDYTCQDCGYQMLG